MRRRRALPALLPVLLLVLSLLLTGCSVTADQITDLLEGGWFTSDTDGPDDTEADPDAESTEDEADTDGDTEDAEAESETEEAETEESETEEAETEETDADSAEVIEAQQAAVISLPMDADAGLNPFTSTSLANSAFFPLIYESLFTVTPEFTAEPLLCRDYTCSDDELTWAFGIQQGVYFSDGSSLTADAVVYSLELAWESELYSARFAYVESITATSDYQVVITLTTAMENLPVLLDIPIVRSGTGYASSPAGTGPYVLTVSGDTGTLVQSGLWWQDTELPFRRIELVQIDDVLDQRDKFENGEVDLVLTDPNTIGAATYHSDYELWSQDTTIMQYLGFNMDSSIFTLDSIRSAMTHLLDRATIVSDYAGSMALAACLPCSPASSLYDTKLAANYDYDLEAFEEAIEEAGLTDSDGDGILEWYGVPMSGTLLVCSDSTQRVYVANYIADLMNELGFDITVDALPDDEYQEAMYYRDFDFYLAEVRLTADFDLTSFFTSGGIMNYGGMTNEDVVELCEASLENSGNYYNLFETIMDEGLLCPILFKTRAVYSSRGAVSGLDPAPSNIFYNLAEISCYGN